MGHILPARVEVGVLPLSLLPQAPLYLIATVFYTIFHKNARGKAGPSPLCWCDTLQTHSVRLWVRQAPPFAVTRRFCQKPSPLGEEGGTKCRMRGKDPLDTVSILALSGTFGASSPKGRALGKTIRSAVRQAPHERGRRHGVSRDGEGSSLRSGCRRSGPPRAG